MRSVSRGTLQRGDSRRTGAGRDGDAARGREAEDVLDSLSEVVFRTDAEGRWTYLNRAWTTLTGFDVVASLGARFLDYVHPDEVEYTVTLFMSVVAGGADHCHHETRYRTRDGSYRRVQIRATVVRDTAGAVVGNIGTILDVTAARRDEKTIGEHAALLDLVSTGVPVGELPVGVALYDADLRLWRGSPVIDEIVGVPQCVGDRLDQLTERLSPAGPHQRCLGGEWGMIAAALATHHAQVGDLDLRGEHDSARSVRITVIPWLRGGEEMLALVFTDITDLRRAEREAHRLCRRAERGRAWLAASAEITTSVLAAPDPRDALGLVARIGRRTAAADLGILAVPDEDGALVVTAAAVAPDLPADAEALRGLTVTRDPDAGADMPTAGQTVVLKGLHVRGNRAVPTPELTLTGALAVPLRLTRNTSPIMILGYRSSSPHLAASDIELVEAFAADAALALDLAEAHQEHARLAVLEDRDRIARDLGDLVLQRLFAIGLHLQSLTRVAGDLISARLNAAIAALDQTIEEIRRTILHVQSA
ncbi:PAS domain S-box-containing protein [Parafrankia irregularis]|uniref:histidine kinase n=1 Tax=Parafrankia irregularis TaxID=795642 RepID=A0A0S4QWK9_9ACTN|nr:MULTISPECIES: PAS domain-containing protein [Frankiaceae]KPM50831.1 histidine kinase [Frankia sp. R43]MBE3204835.1 PAS domain-containing protein [Parafrankia sp. CH37]CUU59176.1 PAS domain S-box-containing protein [Parafrankia irregularis]